MKDMYINEALNEARKAYNANEVPVGAIIVKNGEIIAKAHNLKTKTNNIFNHAEIIAIKNAVDKIGDWRLIGCEMYITLEPCPMCASAIQQSRIDRIYIGAQSNIKSNKEIIERIFNNDEFYHKVDYKYLYDDNCSSILTDFFENKR
jgi:tRNA(adenine34) deaminase